jgi:dimethylargininase
MQFTKAIVKIPCKRMTDGLSSAGLGKPDHRLALHQHGKYVEALRECGLDVRVLPADENYPDSTFVEDTALLTPEFALITLPGAPSRQGEIINMKDILPDYYERIEIINPPGTLEAGDVMMVGDHYYIGLSERTNESGAKQLIRLLHDHGMSGSVVEFSGMLHLKSGISYLENNTILAIESFSRHPVFSSFNAIPVPDEESYAANSLWINDTVLVPEGYPVTMKNIQHAGYKTITLDMSEFRKLDGGLSCLSLRF